jgi:hypothetical protein
MRRRAFIAGLVAGLVSAPAGAVRRSLKEVLFSRPKRIRVRSFKSVAYAASPRSFTFNDGANVGDHIVVGLVSYSATSTITSVACNGESDLTAIGSLLRPGAGVLSDGAIQLFYLASVTTPGVKTITITLDAATNLEAGGYILTGGDAASFLDTSATASTNTVSITTAREHNAIIAFGLSTGAQSAAGQFVFDDLPHNLQRDGLHRWLDSGPAGAKTAAFNGTGNALIFAASFNVAP